MATNNSSSAGGGIGFTGALTIAFIALKLTHVINWTWTWVLSPLWIAALFVVGFLISIALIAGVIHLVKRKPKPTTRPRW